MSYTQATADEESFRISNIVRNAVRALVDAALESGQPELVAAAKAPIHFVRDETQVGKMTEKHLGLLIFWIRPQHPAMREQIPIYMPLGVPPEHARQVIQAAYSAQSEAYQLLEAYYNQVLAQLQQQGGTP